MGSRTHSDIAILMDWDNWWGTFYSAGPSLELNYIQELQRYYEVLRCQNYNVDLISDESDFAQYKLIITPVWYMVKGQDDEKMRTFVKNGGTWIATFFSGYVQENDLVVTGGYPGKLRDILGIWVEEEDALPKGAENAFCYHGQKYPATLLCDLLHLEGAKEIDASGYEQDFYAGMPVLTCNDYGKGKAYYVATASNEAFYQAFLNDICRACGITPVLKTPEGVEVTSRENDLERFCFVLNHTDSEQEVVLPFSGENVMTGEKRKSGNCKLKPKDVLILAVQKERQ